MRRSRGSAAASRTVADKTGYSAGLTVVATLVVTNRTAEPALLRFLTTQRYDFAITDQAGKDVWRWGADMMFGRPRRHSLRLLDGYLTGR